MTTPNTDSELAAARSLCIEVCHDLINRALRNEVDEFPDHRYSKICREQEAAIRAVLAEIDRLRAKLDQERRYSASAEAGAATNRRDAERWLAEADRLRAERDEMQTKLTALTERIAILSREP